MLKKDFKKNHSQKKLQFSFFHQISKIFLFSVGSIIALGILIFIISFLIVPSFFPLDNDINIIILSKNNDVVDHLTLVAMLSNKKQLVVKKYQIQDQLAKDLFKANLVSNKKLLSLLSFYTRNIIDVIIIDEKNEQFSSPSAILNFLLSQRSQLGNQLFLTYFFFIKEASNSSLFVKEDELLDLTAYYTHAYKKCDLSLINNTNTNGLASALSDLLTENNFLVMRISNATEATLESKIYYDETNPNCSLVYKKLSQLIPNQVIIENNQDIVSKQRSSLVLFIGDDLINPFTQ